VRQRKGHVWAVPNRHSGCTGGRAHRWADLLSKPRAEGSNSNRKPLPANDLTLSLALRATTEPAIPCHLGSESRPSTSTAPDSSRFWQQRATVPLRCGSRHRRNVQHGRVVNQLRRRSRRRRRRVFCRQQGPRGGPAKTSPRPREPANCLDAKSLQPALPTNHGPQRFTFAES
jgi:hypothetical protein